VGKLTEAAQAAHEEIRALCSVASAEAAGIAWGSHWEAGDDWDHRDAEGLYGAALDAWARVELTNVAEAVAEGAEYVITGRCVASLVEWVEEQRNQQEDLDD
jgi:hypothetical protein